MADPLNIEIRGLKELQAKMKKLGLKLSDYMANAAVEASKELIAVEGLQKYPPATAANFAPVPYYIRGVGMQYSANSNDGKSEKLGSRFVVKKIGYGAVIGNTASYAPYVIGANQARRMETIGWKNILKWAASQVNNIKRTFDGWVNKALKDSGLK